MDSDFDSALDNLSDVENEVKKNFRKRKVLDISGDNVKNVHVAVTSIVSAIECKRRSVFMQFFQNSFLSDFTIHTYVGKITHRLFQYRIFVLSDKFVKKHCRVEPVKTVSDLKCILNFLISDRQFLVKLYILKVSQKEFLHIMYSKLLSIIKWSDIFLNIKNEQNRAEYKMLMDELINNDNHNNYYFEIDSIEHEVVSDESQCKGFIDMTCMLRSRKDANFKMFLPVELKSSASSSYRITHKAQLILYQYLLKREQYTCDCGILIYLNDNNNINQKSFVVVRFNERECEQLLGLKDFLVANRDLVISDLPEFTSDSNSCRFCSVKDTCKLFDNYQSGSLAFSEQMPSVLKNQLLAIDEKTLNYFIKWTDILFILSETKEKFKDNGDLEKVHFFIEKVVNHDFGGDFYVHLSLLETEKEINLNNLFDASDYVILNASTIRSQYKGYVESVLNDKIVVKSTRPVSNQMYNSSDFQAKPLITVTKAQHLTDNKALAGQMANLLTFTLSSSAIKPYIIDLQVPSFELSKSTTDRIDKNELNELNSEQKRAVYKCLAAKNYALIHGLPGTGKSNTIAVLLNIYMALNKKVLIVCNTNIAVDNILLKYTEKYKNASFVRIGRDVRINERLHDYTINRLIERNNLTTTDDLSDFFDQNKIFATTCQSLNNDIFQRVSSFDVCIIDEASQVFEISLLNAIIKSDIFLLFGDHKQLPPVITSKDERVKLAKVSLFEKLINRYPHASVTLTTQYRMHTDISNLASEFFYDGKMKSYATNTNRVLYNNNTKNNKNLTVGKIIDTLKNSSVVFCNVKNNSAQKSVFMCENEAVLIHDLVDFFVNTQKIDASKITVITSYNDQLSLLKSKLNCKKNFEKVSIGTIDSYQGYENDIVIVSYVRKESSQYATHMQDTQNMQNDNRVNVSVTRAKNTLILLGEEAWLARHYKIFGPIIAYLKEKQAVVHT